MAAPKKVDYERIEPGWRAGIESPIQLAADYTKATGISVSQTAIIKHFKKLGVPRDLAAKVKAKSDAMVLEAMVSTKVYSEVAKRDSEIVNDAAGIVTQVRINQRTDISRLRTLANKLMQELEGQCADPELLANLGEMMRTPSESGADKLNDLYQKIISTPSRVDSVKKLADTIRQAIALEREAYNLDAPAGAGPAATLTESQRAILDKLVKNEY